MTYLLTLATLAASTPAAAGGQSLVAEVAPDGRSVVVRTAHCGLPAASTLVGRAEGWVGTERTSVRLQVARTDEPGVFSVARTWPVDGSWALVLTVEGERSLSTLVDLQPGEPLRIRTQEPSYDPPSAARVDAALRDPAQNGT